MSMDDSTVDALKSCSIERDIGYKTEEKNDTDTKVIL